VLSRKQDNLSSARISEHPSSRRDPSNNTPCMYAYCIAKKIALALCHALFSQWDGSTPQPDVGAVQRVGCALAVWHIHAGDANGRAWIPFAARVLRVRLHAHRHPTCGTARGAITDGCHNRRSSSSSYNWRNTPSVFLSVRRRCRGPLPGFT
jgi:hypothetical protein